jgi:protein gp37
MAENSSIEWTHHTFNPWRGCSKVHEGCTHCYAEKALPNAMQAGGPLKWGEVWQGGQRIVAAESMWTQPAKWARAAARAGERHRVFCASLADVLEVPADVPESIHRAARPLRQRTVEAVREALERARQRLWQIIRETAAVNSVGKAVPMRRTSIDRGEPGLDWLLLTKRPENWRLVPEDVRPLVWLGTSVSSQKTVDEWVWRLLKAEGFRHRFLSIEPLVGPVDLRSMESNERCVGCGEQPLADALNQTERCGCTVEGAEPLAWKRIDWAIIGGESGASARPCNVEWIRDILLQCAEAEVPVFVKQLGATWATEHRATTLNEDGEEVPDRKGGDMKNFPEDLRVRQFPKVVRS